MEGECEEKFEWEIVFMFVMEEDKEEVLLCFLSSLKDKLYVFIGYIIV